MTLEARWDRRLAGSVTDIRYCSCGIVCVIESSESGGPTARLFAADTGKERGHVALDGGFRGASYHDPPGLLFVTTLKNRVYALAPETGETRWTAAGSQVEAAASDVVYAWEETTLRAIGTDDGTHEWSSVLPEPIYRVSKLDDAGDRLGVIVGEHRDRTLVGVDAATGAERFRHPASDVANYQIDGETILAVLGNDNVMQSLRRIDGRTGAERWTYAVGETGRIDDANIEVRDEAIYVYEGEHAGTTALDPVTGRPTGVLDGYGLAIRCGPMLCSAPAGAERGELHAIDPDTGERSWRFAADGKLVGTAFESELGDFFFADWDDDAGAGNVYRVDGTTGAVRWRCPVGGEMKTLRVDDGPLVAAYSSGNVHPMMRAMFAPEDSDEGVYGIDREHGRAEWSFSADDIVVRGATGRFVLVREDNFMSEDESLYVLRRSDGSVSLEAEYDSFEFNGETLFAATGSTITAYPLTDRPHSVSGEDEESGALPAADTDDGARGLPTEDGTADGEPIPAPGDGLAEPKGRGETPVSFCPDCGADLDPDADANFCMACGAELPE